MCIYTYRRNLRGSCLANFWQAGIILFLCLTASLCNFSTKEQLSLSNFKERVNCQWPFLSSGRWTCSTDPSWHEDLIDNLKKKKTDIIFVSQIERKIDEKSSISSYNCRLSRVLTQKMILEQVLNQSSACVYYVYGSFFRDIWIYICYAGYCSIKGTSRQLSHLEHL